MTTGADISTAQRMQYLLQAGFNYGEALVMTALSYKECPACDLAKTNGATQSQGDVGLFQINSQNWGSTNFTTSKWGNLADPQVSAIAARSIYAGAGGGQQGFKQWCTYPGGCNVQGGSNQYTDASLQKKILDIIAELEAGGASGGNPDPGGAGGGSGGTGGDGSGVDVPGPFGISFPIEGSLVVSTGIFFLLIGAIAWKGGAVVKVLAPSSAPAKAMKIANS